MIKCYLKFCYKYEMKCIEKKSPKRGENKANLHIDFILSI